MFTVLCLPIFTEAQLISNPVEFVVIGDQDNPNDPLTGRGQVRYVYEISKYEITWSQYAEFINAYDPLGVNKASVYSDGWTQQLSFVQSRPVGEKYVVGQGYERLPAVVREREALRFINWLQTSGDDTEDGTYTITGGVFGQINWQRNGDSNYWLPDINEWYKAAFYQGPDSDLGNIVGSDYAPFATGGLDVNNSPPPGDMNSAAYGRFGRDDEPSPVGSYIYAASHYGTFDQSGNAEELVERGNYIGGRYSDDKFALESDILNLGFEYDFGFRVARRYAPTLVEAELQVFDAVELNWFGENGVRYQVQSSSNMIDWMADGDAINGTGEAMSVWRRRESMKKFFRLYTE